MYWFTVLVPLTTELYALSVSLTLSSCEGDLLCRPGDPVGGGGFADADGVVRTVQGETVPGSGSSEGELRGGVTLPGSGKRASCSGGRSNSACATSTTSSVTGAAAGKPSAGPTGVAGTTVQGPGERAPLGATTTLAVSSCGSGGLAGDGAGEDGRRIMQQRESKRTIQHFTSESWYAGFSSVAELDSPS